MDQLNNDGTQVAITNELQTFNEGEQITERVAAELSHKDESFIRYRHAHHIETRTISWLWPDRIARGKISIIAGNPGLGKSQITASMAATVSKGGKWPDGSESIVGRTLLLSAEDSVEDTIIPRLMAADTDLSQITFAEILVTTNNKDKNTKFDQIDISKNLLELEKLINALKDVVLVIIDPITAYMANTNDNNNGSIRALLAPLSELAARLNVAIVCVSHNNKNSDQQAIFRVIGSIGFVAAARAAFLVTKDKDDPNTILFLPIKNNISQDKTGLSFQIESCTVENDIKTSRVKWSDKPITISADEAIGVKTKSDSDDDSPIHEAEIFLKKILTFGPRYSKDILEQAEAEMISEKTLRRAKKNLKIIVGREGFGNGSKPYWKLPRQEATSTIDAQSDHTQPTNAVTTYGANGHLLDS
ncbi:MAG: AAA family ATPase [Gammaproteobacteria bacterium]|nr:AAA family ATPase [Gammaproteobacteria bacterium]